MAINLTDDISLRRSIQKQAIGMLKFHIRRLTTDLTHRVQGYGEDHSWKAAYRKQAEEYCHYLLTVVAAKPEEPQVADVVRMQVRKAFREMDFRGLPAGYLVGQCA